MANRMDKYKTVSRNDNVRRTNKNKDLYDNFYTKDIYYDEKSSVDNAYEIDNSVYNYTSRSDYQKVKDYRQLLKPKEISSKEELRKYLEADEDVNYDLNKVMEKAKKNRQIEEQELERKRKIRNSEYNIFEGASLEELKKRKAEIDKEKDELEELINTISSKTLKEDVAKEMEKDLLDDLLADNEDEKVGNVEEISESISKIILDKEEEKKEKTGISDIDRSFYTKSMDLSEEDFDVDDDDFYELEGNKNLGIKIFLIIVLLVVIAVAAYLLVVGK